MEPTSPSEAFICLKVKDVLGLTRIDTLQRFVYPADTTFQTLFDDVSNRFKIDIAEFDLTYQDRMDLVRRGIETILFLGYQSHF